MTVGDRLRGYCPSCGGERVAIVRGEHVVRHYDDEDGTSTSDTGMILECGGCETIYFRRDYWFSEWETLGEHPITGEPRMEGGTRTEYWPPPTMRKAPEWSGQIAEADPTLGTLISETYAALNGGLRVLAGVGARSVFDRATEQLRIDPAITFEEKLNALVDTGKVGVDEKRALEVLVDAGSAAAHRGWHPKVPQLNTMLNVLEAFLYRAFVLGGGLAELRQNVPPKPKRQTPRRPRPPSGSPSRSFDPTE